MFAYDFMKLYCSPLSINNLIQIVDNQIHKTSCMFIL